MSPEESDDKPRYQRPPPQVVKCPNCDEEEFEYHTREKVWRCNDCGYEEKRD